MFMLSGLRLLAGMVVLAFCLCKAGSKELPVSKQWISHWIVDTIYEAYCHVGMGPPLGIQAHSAQTLNISFACKWCLFTQDLCFAATWADGSVFAKFYSKTHSSGGFLSHLVLTCVSC